MSLFLLFSLPLTLLIFLKEKCKQQISLSKAYFYIACSCLGFVIFCLLYLIHEFFLFELMQVNYDSLFSLGLSLLIQDQIYYYMIPLFLFAFFFSFNPNSLFANNSILFICFVFGVLFAKNFVIYMNSSKLYNYYEYLLLPFIHVIELLFSAIIVQYGFFQNEAKKRINSYKFIFSSIFVLELLIVTIKELMIVNLFIYSFITMTVLVVLLSIILTKNVKV